jgi:hypothetical protein
MARWWKEWREQSPERLFWRPFSFSRFVTAALAGRGLRERERLRLTWMVGLLE